MLYVRYPKLVRKKSPLIGPISAENRVAPVRFGSVTVWGWKGSISSGFRFRRFLYKKGFSVFQYIFKGKDSSGSGFGSWKTVPAVPVPLSVLGKTVLTVLILTKNSGVFLAKIG